MSTGGGPAATGAHATTVGDDTGGTATAAAGPRATTARRSTGALAAEWTKLWSVRSTWTALLAAVGLGALYPLIVGVSARYSDPGQAILVPHTAAAGTGMLILGQTALLALASLTIAAEYSTGSIRTALQCVPQRPRLLFAKCLVLLPVLAPAGVVLTGTGTLVSMVAAGDAGLPLDHGALVRIAAGAAGYLWLAGTVVIAAGAAIRSVAGTVTAALLLFLLLPMILSESGIPVLTRIAAGLPGSAGRVLLTAGTEPYGPAAALAVLVGWAVLAQLGAGLLMGRRDG